MNLHWIDILIIVLYLAGMLIVGFYLSKLASKDLKSYFLGGNKIKWYYLGLSNASGMFDISGAMWTVSILLIYGLKVHGCLVMACLESNFCNGISCCLDAEIQRFNRR